ncbi:MAG: metallophosphoesterase [Halobacteria archaeon]
MTQRIALIGDTHIPSRSSGVPSWVVEKVESCDVCIHTGDFDSQEGLEEVRGFTDGLTAVHGNMDSFLDLPDTEKRFVEDVEFVVTHGTGPKGGYEDRVAGIAREEAETDNFVAVSGHTHEVLDEVMDGVRILNPGSCTGAAPATRETMMVAEVDGDEINVVKYEE